MNSQGLQRCSGHCSTAAPSHAEQGSALISGLPGCEQALSCSAPPRRLQHLQPTAVAAGSLWRLTAHIQPHAPCSNPTQVKRGQMQLPTRGELEAASDQGMCLCCQASVPPVLLLTGDAKTGRLLNGPAGAEPRPSPPNETFSGAAGKRRFLSHPCTNRSREHFNRIH